ncbi:MAG: DUF58 domain-containing protein [Verrucomicrobiota bacterium]
MVKELELHQCDPLDARQFVIAVKRLADALSYGTDRSPFRGSGLEYIQSRRYEPGDPIKAIDWRVTARTGKYFVKEYETPKRMPAYFLIDTSASMTISSQPLSKYAWAVQIAGGLAFACLDRVSPVGIVGAGERDFRVEPSLGRDRILQWLHELRFHNTAEGTSLGRRVSELGANLPNTALIFLLTDFHDPTAMPAVRLAAQRHEVVALQLRDPAESGIKGGGIFHAREAESGEAFVATGRRHWIDPEGVAAECKKGGVDHLLLQTDRPIAAPLREFLRARGVLGRGAR